ncbi:MAG: ATP-binding protein [Actinomycetota bacterium]
MRRLPTGTVTFLFTDIEGSTRLLDELGAKRFADALAEHRRLLREAFKRHGGVEVDTQGDAFFVAFQDASGALAAADEGQGALADGPIRVRMALHTGEPVVTDEGYVGMDVHRAARICSTAHGGQVVLSGTTRALLGDAGLADLGLHRLKDLGRPEKLFQLGRDKFPPLRSLNATNLPAQPSTLIGRERELSELAALVPDVRLVVVTGAGGTGKTRLTLQVAAEVVETFIDGVYWVSLAPIIEAELVFPTIASVLGAQGDVAAHIDERRMLLLLDNLEQVLDIAPRLSELLRSCPNLHLLITSRALLRIDGEHEYQVEPLPTHDAVALFRERAPVAFPEEAIVEICRRVDCLPLAVELAAARTRILSADAMLARLEQRLPVLTGGRRDAPERQRTLRATIEWSYGLLDKEEQLLFRRLAVFAGSFDAAGAEAVAGAPLETLQSIIEQSLLRRWGSGRLGMLETIHEFSLQQLEESGEAEPARRRLAEFLLELAETANLTDEAEGPQRVDLVIPEAPNVRAALEWSHTRGDAEIGLQLAIALEHYWTATSPFEGIRFLGLLLERGPQLPLELRARALRVLGGVIFIVGRFEEGTRLYEESLAGYRELGDERGIGILLYRLANSELVREDLVAARSLAEESGQLLQRARFRKGETIVLGTLGDIEILEGNHDRGIELMRQSIEFSKEIGFSWWTAVSLAVGAERLLSIDRLEEAEQWALEALPETRAIGERQFLLTALAVLARIAAQTGRPERSGTLWGAIETEEALGPVGQWEDERAAYEAAVKAAEGPDFQTGRDHGRRLTLGEAVDYALAVAKDEHS